MSAIGSRPAGGGPMAALEAVRATLLALASEYDGGARAKVVLLDFTVPEGGLPSKAIPCDSTRYRKISITFDGVKSGINVNLLSDGSDDGECCTWVADGSSDTVEVDQDIGYTAQGGGDFCHGTVELTFTAPGRWFWRCSAFVGSTPKNVRFTHGEIGAWATALTWFTGAADGMSAGGKLYVEAELL